MKVTQSYVSCVLHINSWCFLFMGSFMKISQTVFNSQSGHEHMADDLPESVYCVVLQSVLFTSHMRMNNSSLAAYA